MQKLTWSTFLSREFGNKVEFFSVQVSKYTFMILYLWEVTEVYVYTWNILFSLSYMYYFYWSLQGSSKILIIRFITYLVLIQGFCMCNTVCFMQGWYGIISQPLQNISEFFPLQICISPLLELLWFFLQIEVEI